MPRITRNPRISFCHDSRDLCFRVFRVFRGVRM
jgi:hypothetical protein